MADPNQSGDSPSPPTPSPQSTPLIAQQRRLVINAHSGTILQLQINGQTYPLTIGTNDYTLPPGIQLPAELQIVVNTTGASVNSALPTPSTPLPTPVEIDEFLQFHPQLISPQDVPIESIPLHRFVQIVMNLVRRVESADLRWRSLHFTPAIITSLLDRAYIWLQVWCGKAEPGVYCAILVMYMTCLPTLESPQMTPLSTLRLLSERPLLLRHIAYATHITSGHLAEPDGAGAIARFATMIKLIAMRCVAEGRDGAVLWNSTPLTSSSISSHISIYRDPLSAPRESIQWARHLRRMLLDLPILQALVHGICSYADTPLPIHDGQPHAAHPHIECDGALESVSILAPSRVCATGQIEEDVDFMCDNDDDSSVFHHLRYATPPLRITHILILALQRSVYTANACRFLLNRIHNTIATSLSGDALLARGHSHPIMSPSIFDRSTEPSWVQPRSMHMIWILDQLIATPWIRDACLHGIRDGDDIHTRVSSIPSHSIVHGENPSNEIDGEDPSIPTVVSSTPSTEASPESATDDTPSSQLDIDMRRPTSEMIVQTVLGCFNNTLVSTITLRQLMSHGASTIGNMIQYTCGAAKGVLQQALQQGRYRSWIPLANSISRMLQLPCRIHLSPMMYAFIDADGLTALHIVLQAVFQYVARPTLTVKHEITALHASSFTHLLNHFPGIVVRVAETLSTLALHPAIARVQQSCIEEIMKTMTHILQIVYLANMSLVGEGSPSRVPIRMPEGIATPLSTLTARLGTIPSDIWGRGVLSIEGMPIRTMNETYVISLRRVAMELHEVIEQALHIGDIDSDD